MTAAELRAGIDQALAEVDFDALGGASVAYCTAVRDRLRELLPGAALDVCHHYRDVAAEARDGQAQVLVVVPV